jgi:hypothetical protein
VPLNLVRLATWRLEAEEAQRDLASAATAVTVGNDATVERRERDEEGEMKFRGAGC